MLEWLQNGIINLTHGEKLIELFETFYSGLSTFNQFVFIIGFGIVFIIGLYTIFKKILKMSMGLVKFALFAVIIIYLAKIIFNF